MESEALLKTVHDLETVPIFVRKQKIDCGNIFLVGFCTFIWSVFALQQATCGGFRLTVALL